MKQWKKCRSCDKDIEDSMYELCEDCDEALAWQELEYLDDEDYDGYQ